MHEQHVQFGVAADPQAGVGAVDNAAVNGNHGRGGLVRRPARGA